MVVLRDVMVPMRDGAKLATDVHLPGQDGQAVSGRFPVILEADVEVTGPITVHLWVASDAPDTDFTAKLVDVHPPGPDYPDGFALNLTGGILRMRYRGSGEQPEPMVPGRVYAVIIELFPTSNRFGQGHRIRLDVSSSNYPHFDINPNTGEPEGEWTATRVATNSVFMDAARPSHVVLPLVPRERSA
jgi:hypothetical protein